MKHRTAFALLAAISLGCFKTSPPVIFHTLRPMAIPSSSPCAIALEVMPVQLPEMLQRPQLVSVQGPERYGLSDTHHWGNPLDKEIQRVLVEDLSRLLGTQTIVAYPKGDHIKATHRLLLDIQQLEGQPGGQLKLQATWILMERRGGQALLLRKIALQEPVENNGLDALVVAHSRLLAALDRQIAEELQRSIKVEKQP
jgi:uncharacterized protein